MKPDIDALRRELGRKTIDHDVATAPPMAGMALVFERKETPPGPGQPIPPGWHWTLFWAMSPRATLGADGLPKETDVLPQMPFPRRMFAGSKMTFHDDILVGDALRRETEFTHVDLRQGGSGQLIFAVSTQRIYTPRGLALTAERQSVFREEVPAGGKSAIPKRETPPSDTPWRRSHHPDIVALFRYSALTFNPHRIHYDRTYATEVEGYPGVVVHGPFSQQCLLDLVRDNTPGRRIATFDMRARAPLFDTAPFEVVGRPTGADSCEVWAVGPGGTIAMSAAVTLR